MASKAVLEIKIPLVEGGIENEDLYEACLEVAFTTSCYILLAWAQSQPIVVLFSNCKKDWEIYLPMQEEKETIIVSR